MAAPAISNTTTKNPTPQDPTKFYYHFLYKAIIVSIFLLILPLLPSQAPNFINQNWELLHLLFAGIAISYGLFSRRSNDVIQTHKEKESSSDAYVSRFLQMSSLFEDNNHDSDETKITQSWNTNYHQYHHHRNEPEVILEAPKTSRIIEKPLLLPVRSLKYRLSDTLSAQSLDESKSSSVSVDGSVSKSDHSRRFSEGGETEDDVNVVLPSPIPWRSSLSKSQTFGPSRSDSMASSPSLSSPKGKEESFSSPLVESVGKSQTLRQSRSNSMASSPSLSSPKAKEESFSSPLEESQGKNAEDVVKKKKKEIQFQKSFPPPPPPPPPPPMYFKSISMKPRIKNSMEDPARKTVVSMGFEEDDTESEDDDNDHHHHEDVGGGGRRLMVNEENSRSDGSGQDVDKKADEFIAKFREQIRLQRIDSIKRSAARISKNSSR